MIRITFEEAAAFAQPDGLARHEADLFWRAARLVRRAADGGSHPDALIADRPGDLLPGSEFLALLGLEGRPAEEMLDRAWRVRYTRKVQAYEVDTSEPPAVALVPREHLTEELLEALRLGHAPVAAVPFAALKGEVDALRAGGARVRWTRARPCFDLDAPYIDLRVRVRGGRDSRELRTRLPRAAFPDPAALSAFIGEAVGEVPYRL